MALFFVEQERQMKKPVGGIITRKIWFIEETKMGVGRVKFPITKAEHIFFYLCVIIETILIGILFFILYLPYVKHCLKGG